VRHRARLTCAGFGACHGDDRRRRAGWPLLGILTKPGSLSFEGAAPAVYRSSDWAERAFCAACGSCLFHRITLTEGPHAGSLHLAVGTLDDISGLRLGEEPFADRPGGAYAFAGDHRRMTAAETIAFFTGGG
jgi:hypothetical protein